MSNPIDEILDYGLWNEAFNASSQYGTVRYGKRKATAIGEAKQQLYDLMLTVIREDDKVERYYLLAKVFGREK